MVQLRLVYCILIWGFDYCRIEKLHIRFARIISSSKYNAHSEPLHNVLDIFEIEHLQSLLKFVHKFNKDSQLPKYFNPSNMYLGPRFMIMTLETLVESILYISVPKWHRNASDPSFR